MALVNSSRVYLESFVKRAAMAVPHNSSVLDAGAGDCSYKPLFKQMKYESADFCQVDKAYGEITHVCNLAEIPVPSDSYDLVLCTQVLEHVNNPQEIVTELYRVLKPNGVIYASALLFYEEHEAPYDFFRYTRFGLQYLFEGAGFEITELTPLEGYFGTLSYQFDMAGKVLSTQSSQVIEAYGLARFFLLRAMVPIFRRLARMFARMDLQNKTSIGMCKNYTIVARKPAQTA